MVGDTYKVIKDIPNGWFIADDDYPMRGLKYKGKFIGDKDHWTRVS